MAQLLSANVSGTWKTARKIHVNVSGTWKAATNVYVNVSGTWKQVLSAAPAAPTVAISSEWEYVWRATEGTNTAPTVSVTAYGGSGNYTYLWEWVSGVTFTVYNPVPQAVVFSAYSTPYDYREGTYRCKVTDNDTGLIGYSAQITIGMEWG